MNRSFSIIILCCLLAAICTLSGCKKDPCDGVVCLNGGACDGDGNCICPSGYTGEHCETNVSSNPCAGITCQNGGTCVNGVCNCPTGYTGTYCQTAITPSQVLITQIVIYTFPATDNGAGWDLLSSAEMYLSINQGTSSNNNGLITSFYQDVSTTYDYTYNVNWLLSSPQNNYVLGLWDEDDLDADDFMTGVYFRPTDYAAGQPNYIDLSTTYMYARLYVNWIY